MRLTEDFPFLLSQTSCITNTKIFRIMYDRSITAQPT